MMDYRAFLLDRDGRIVGVHAFQARRDEDALLTARGLEHGGEVELWQRARKVGLVRPARLAPGSRLTCCGPE